MTSRRIPTRPSSASTPASSGTWWTAGLNRRRTRCWPSRADPERTLAEARRRTCRRITIYAAPMSTRSGGRRPGAAHERGRGFRVVPPSNSSARARPVAALIAEVVHARRRVSSDPARFCSRTAARTAILSGAAEDLRRFDCRPEARPTPRRSAIRETPRLSRLDAFARSIEAAAS